MRIMVKSVFCAAWLAMAVAVDLPGSPATEEADPRALPFPRIGPYEVLRGDFHVHTIRSDGRLTPRERILEAWLHGYDVIAITDHGNFDAYEEALPWAEALDLILIRGIETGLAEREHLVGLGFGAEYTPRDSHRWAEEEGEERVFYRDQWRDLVGTGGFVIYAHPHVGWREPVQWALDEGLLRGIEVKNDVVGSDWNTVESHGTNWYPFALDWAVDRGLTLFANSDVHEAREGGEAVTLVLARERTAQSVLEALREGRTIAWFNDMLCGSEGLLRRFLSELIQVRFVELEGERASRVVIENRGPVALRGVLASDEGITLNDGSILFTVEPHGRTFLDGDFEDEVRVRWRNLWIRSNQNLISEYSRPRF